MSCPHCFHCQQEEARSRGQTLVPWGGGMLVLEPGESLIEYYDADRRSTIWAILKNDGSQQRLEEIPDAIY